MWLNLLFINLRYRSCKTKFIAIHNSGKIFFNLNFDDNQMHPSRGRNC
jgi:hypothetical protein